MTDIRYSASNKIEFRDNRKIEILLLHPVHPATKLPQRHEVVSFLVSK
jgi:hypothetical protein